MTSRENLWFKHMVVESNIMNNAEATVSLAKLAEMYKENNTNSNDFKKLLSDLTAYVSKPVAGFVNAVSTKLGEFISCDDDRKDIFQMILLEFIDKYWKYQADRSGFAVFLKLVEMNVMRNYCKEYARLHRCQIPDTMISEEGEEINIIDLYYSLKSAEEEFFESEYDIMKNEETRFRYAEDFCRKFGIKGDCASIFALILDDMRVKDVAAILETTENAVSMKLARARKCARRSMEMV